MKRLRGLIIFKFVNQKNPAAIYTTESLPDYEVAVFRDIISNFLQSGSERQCQIVESGGANANVTDTEITNGRDHGMPLTLNG
jgi:hypothetical protein